MKTISSRIGIAVIGISMLLGAVSAARAQSAPVISSILSATATNGLPFTYQIAASNDPVRFGASGLPTGLRVSASTGLISGTPTASGSFAASISAINAGGTGSGTLSLVVITPPGPVISSALTLVGTNGFPFTYQIAASNDPTSFGASGLPKGLRVNTATGLISGTATVTGTFAASMSATNAGGKESEVLTISILTPPKPVISSALNVYGTAGVLFSYQITAGNYPTSYEAAGLPPGLSVDPSTGLIFGIPTVIGSSLVSLTATNAGGSATAALTLNILARPVISSTLSATGTDGYPFTYQIIASNSPTGFGATGLPPGVSIDASKGLISGTPAASGTFNAIITASNPASTGAAQLKLNVLPTPPEITSGLTATATNGLVFTYQISGSNHPTRFAATNLPRGLSVKAATGVISGIPTLSGSFDVTMSAANAGGTDSAMLSLIVITPPGPVISGALNATGTSGVAFSYQIAGTNYPTSFGAAGLPAGLSVKESTGLISGKPSVSGTFISSITASNAGGSDTVTCVLVILPPAPAINSSLKAVATNGLGFTYQIKANSDPASFNAIALPTGLSVNTATGLISGTVATNGTFATIIAATNPQGTGSAVLTITVDYNGLKGTYDGLGAVGGTNVGRFTLSLTPNGKFTGKLTLADAQYPLMGLFAAGNAASGTMSAGAATLDVALALVPTMPSISGTITVTATNGTVSYSVESLLRGHFNALTIPPGLAGHYTAIIPGVSGTDPTLPNASGYGTMTIATTGAVNLAAKLGDGTAFTTGGQLHGDGRTWTLFHPLYAGKHPGSIAGEVIFENLTASSADGMIDWIKPAQTSGTYYPAGFSVSTNFQAAKYASPPLISGTPAILTLGGGNLPNVAITAGLMISSKYKVIVTGTNSGSLTLTLNPATGAFSGEFLYPVTSRITPFNGVIYQKPASAGLGLFLGTDQCGNLEITQ